MTRIYSLDVWQARAGIAAFYRKAYTLRAADTLKAERHGNGEHHDLLTALADAELAKADAYQRYADYCDTIIGDLLAQRDHTAEVST